METALAFEMRFVKYSMLEFLKTKENRLRLLVSVTLGFFQIGTE